MARSIIVRLTDDLDGGDADETVTFGLDGKAYEIDLSSKNAQSMRKDLEKYTGKARQVGSQSRSAGRTRPTRSEGSVPTLFSKLDVEEKDRFRAWANLPTARRIGDARVQAWIDAGRP